MMKHPDSCSLRNVARLSAVVTGIYVSPLSMFLPGRDMAARWSALVCVMNGAAVLWRLRAIVHAVIPDHAGNTQPVIVKNHRAALCLGPAVLRHVAPGGNRGLIAKE